MGHRRKSGQEVIICGLIDVVLLNRGLNGFRSERRFPIHIDPFVRIPERGDLLILVLQDVPALGVDRPRLPPDDAAVDDIKEPAFIAEAPDGSRKGRSIFREDMVEEVRVQRLISLFPVPKPEEIHEPLGHGKCNDLSLVEPKDGKRHQGLLHNMQLAVVIEVHIQITDHTSAL